MTADEMRAERDRLEREHIIPADREGGCRRSMFLGDCDDCERYYTLDDAIAAGSVTATECADQKR